MTFRRRITLASAAAVAVAIVLASILIYILTSQQLHHQVDQQLRGRGRTVVFALRRSPAGDARVLRGADGGPFPGFVPGTTEPTGPDGFDAARSRPRHARDERSSRP